MVQSEVPFLKNIGVRSFDFDEARQFINSRIDRREIIPASSGGDTENVLTWQPLAGSTLFGASWSEEVHIRSEPQTTFHAILVRDGGIICKATNTAITAGGILLIAPGKQADLVWQKSTQAVVINLSSRALLDHLGVPCLEMLNQNSLIINPRERDALLIRQGVDCIALQHDTCQGKLDFPLQVQWQNLLLTHFSSRILEASKQSPPILPAKVRMAVEWIHAHIKDPISVSDLLKISGCSRRSLESGFRTYLNTTPARYILCLKLNGVRALLSADRFITVGDAAFSFGFEHLSHFTHQYHKAFGELPSETNRRKRPN